MPAIQSEALQNYIANLPVGAPLLSITEETAAVNTINIDDLPNGKYPKPSDCDGDDAVFIGRIREDISCDNGLAFWCVSDNLRKGAATNAVQIAELLVRTQSAVAK